jgi:hypothetical protein
MMVVALYVEAFVGEVDLEPSFAAPLSASGEYEPWFNPVSLFCLVQ